MDKIINEINEVQQGLGLKYPKDKTKHRRIKLAIAQYIAKHGKRPKTVADIALFLAKHIVKKRTRKPAADRRTTDRRKKVDKQEQEHKELLEKWRNEKQPNATQLPPQAANVFSGTNQSAAAAALNQGTNAERVAAISRAYNPAGSQGPISSNSTAVVPAAPERKDASGKEDKHSSPAKPVGLNSDALLEEYVRRNDILNDRRNKLLKETTNLEKQKAELERQIQEYKVYGDTQTAKNTEQRKVEFVRRLRIKENAQWTHGQLYNKLKDDFKGHTDKLTAMNKDERLNLFREKQEYKDWLPRAIAAVNEDMAKHSTWGKGDEPTGGSADITSNIQLAGWMKDVPGFQYVLSRNQPLKAVKPANSQGQRSWIMNLSPLGEQGTHWVAILQTPTSLEYFNSLGDDVPRDIVANMLRLPGASTQKFKENALETQSKTTSNCGYHAMKFIIDRLKVGFPEATGFSDAEKDHSKEGEEALKQWREQYPAFKIIGGFAAPGPSANLSNQLDNREIQMVTVERAPIHSALSAFLKLISLGQISKAMREAQYDKLFHLSVVLELEDGSRVRLEKNETVQLSRYTQRPDTEVMPAGNPSCTLADFVQRGADYQGGSFWTWEVQNNCQVFVNSLLEGNHLMTPALKAFVLQDMKSIMKSSPSWLEGMMNGVTKVAGRLRNIFDRIFT